MGSSVFEPQIEETAFLYPGFINIPLKKTNVLLSWGQADSVCSAVIVAVAIAQMAMYVGDGGDGLRYSSTNAAHRDAGWL